jgi:hypothetical protein
MNKGIIAFSFAIFLLIDIGQPVRAEELRFQCTDGGGGFPVIVDTKTKSVLLGEPNLEHGRAAITGSSISMTLDNDPSYRGSINRRTGALSTSEGSGSCTLAK